MALLFFRFYPTTSPRPRYCPTERYCFAPALDELIIAPTGLRASFETLFRRCTLSFLLMQCLQQSCDSCLNLQWKLRVITHFFRGSCINSLILKNLHINERDVSDPNMWSAASESVLLINNRPLNVDRNCAEFCTVGLGAKELRTPPATERNVL